MKLSPRQRKWLKRFLILLAARVVLGGIFYYIVTYRFKNIIEYVVNRESQGAYTFDASDVTVSLWDKSILLENAALVCNDTSASHSYDVQIPQAYLQIQSWSHLIFQREIEVDSLSIKFPGIKLHEKTLRQKKHLSFHASTLLQNLKKLLLHIKVQSFHIHNGSFSYRNALQPGELNLSSINLLIRDVSDGNNPEDHLLFSDDIDLVLENQHWVMPGGKQEIRFKKLHFSGKNQLFRLDSCSILSVQDKRKVSLSADHLFFNSKQFSAGLQHDAFLIDTLICFQPVLNIETEGRKKHKIPLDTAGLSAIGKNADVFNEIGVNYIDVVNGRLLVKYTHRTHHTYASDKTGVRIFNLTMNRNGNIGVRADSIQFGVKNISFYTADSMFQITAAELAFEHNDLVLKKASFGPSAFNHKTTGLTFTTDALRLNDIDIGYLLNKKLKARGAALERPSFVLKGKAAAKQKADTLRGIERFYGTLHEIKALIGVQKLLIKDGSLHYTRENDATFVVELTGINANILPETFLRSDSLIDVKHAIPSFAIAGVKVNTGKVKLGITGYTLDGIRQHNRAQSFRLSLANGTAIEGQQVSWVNLNWDLLRKEKKIEIDLLKAEKLAVHQKSNDEPSSSNEQHKAIPQLNIKAIEVAQANISMLSPKHRLSMNGKGVKITALISGQQLISWNKIEGTFNQIAFHNAKMDIAAKELELKSDSFLTFKNVRIRNGDALSVDIPVLKILCSISSSNPDDWHVSTIDLNDPEVELVAEDHDADGNAAFVAPAFFVQDLDVHNLKLSYKNAKDSLVVTAKASFNIHAVNVFPGNKFPGKDLVWFDHSRFQIRQVNVQHKSNHITIPSSAIGLINAELGKHAFKAQVRASWEDATAKLAMKDSGLLELQKVSGGFYDDHFAINKGKKQPWQSLLSSGYIEKGQVSFSNSSIAASAGSIKWNPKEELAVIHKLRVSPKDDRDETWRKRKWQSDYITFDCDVLKLHGLHLKYGNDSLIAIREIEVAGANMEVVRDKHQPFKHGVEKLMPTRMISNIKYPLRIDSLTVSKTDIMVSQISEATDELGTIPITNLKAVIRNISNKSLDSLYIKASGNIFSTRIRQLTYAESYADSLSAFRLNMNTSKLALTEFSKITVPLASASVAAGEGDTLYASWTGNTHAAVGGMHFYYNHLNIRLLPKNGADKKPFLLSIENALANKVIHDHNRSPVQFYYERDPEKFVFNYWVKAEFQGILASTGVKSSRKYMKQYKRAKKKYRLS